MTTTTSSYIYYRHIFLHINVNVYIIQNMYIIITMIYAHKHITLKPSFSSSVRRSGGFDNRFISKIEIKLNGV